MWKALRKHFQYRPKTPRLCEGRCCAPRHAFGDGRLGFGCEPHSAVPNWVTGCPGIRKQTWTWEAEPCLDPFHVTVRQNEVDFRRVDGCLGIAAGLGIQERKIIVTDRDVVLSGEVELHEEATVTTVRTWSRTSCSICEMWHSVRTADWMKERNTHDVCIGIEHRLAGDDAEDVGNKLNKLNKKWVSAGGRMRQNHPTRDDRIVRHSQSASATQKLTSVAEVSTHKPDSVWAGTRDETARCGRSADTPLFWTQITMTA